MPVQVIGLLYHHHTSRLRDLPPCDFDLQAIKELAEAHETAGFDSVLVSQSSSMPDPLVLGAYVAGITTRLGFLIAHRPGFIAPTMAARMFATIDRLCNGRATVHVISGAQDSEMLRDGDSLPKHRRYRRSSEYVQIMRRMWVSATPFDFEGEFYRVRQAFCDVKPGGGQVPISWAGASQEAFETAGESADIYAMVGDTLATAGEFAGRARAAAARHGRVLGLTITLCIIVGDTEAAAWERAQQILARIEAGIAARGKQPEAAPHASVALQRLLEQSRKADVIDRNLWMAINRVTGAAGNNTTVVGTASQIVETLLDYYDLGFTQFLLRGFEPLEDARIFGRELIPLLREAVAARDRRAA